ncbi:MAG: YraN family protein [Thermoguttaceae bacterium]|jgi:putative endonuclease|nr:YraN family protein [Thermoguttaceae bacterium]
MSVRDHIAGWLRRWFPEKPLGQRGEDAAARYLRRRGYRILGRGQSWKGGELDIVALKGETIVFVEVRTRQSDVPTRPEESVDLNKQRRLTRLAVGYLKRHRLFGHPARFDVVAVVWPEGRRRPEIRHVENAFPAVGLPGFFS